MTPEQFERLQARHVQLADLFLDETQVDKWPGAGVELQAMDKSTRGDRYWCKKNAVATISLMQRIASLVDHVRAASAAGDPGPEAVQEPQDDLDAEVDAAEREANKLLAGLTRKPAHGKA